MGGKASASKINKVLLGNCVVKVGAQNEQMIHVEIINGAILNVVYGSIY